ncbi:uncharacterized protein LOC135143917 [Zophobas morio]|uniref:uncharacterized protein LOC135119442 n=1 Tax=Zophobas morio TaxID=2755281 RepID=UPI0030832F5C
MWYRFYDQPGKAKETQKGQWPLPEMEDLSFLATEELNPFTMGTVIVMDNASYHSKLLNKIPTTSTKKDDIIHFMRHNDIDIPAGKATKKDLLNCIKQLNMPKQYRIDQIAKEHGHIVLRLPPHYCVMNPIELIWSSLKRSIRRNNTTPNLSAQVVDLIRQEVNNITIDLWKNCVKHVIDIENSYVSPNFQEFVVHLEDEDNDDDLVDYFFDSDND